MKFGRWCFALPFLLVCSWCLKSAAVEAKKEAFLLYCMKYKARWPDRDSMSDALKTRFFCIFNSDIEGGEIPISNGHIHLDIKPGLNLVEILLESTSVFRLS